MAPEEIADILKSAFAEAVIEAKMDSNHPAVIVSGQPWPEIARFLRDDPRLQLNMLRCISGVDQMADGVIEVIYDLISMIPAESGEMWGAQNAIAIKIKVPRDDAHIPSVADVWPAADWHEREVFDLLGVTFENHPDPRRILCPDDWIGHPLRKDYESPREFNGIKGEAEVE